MATTLYTQRQCEHCDRLRSKLEGKLEEDVGRGLRDPSSGPPAGSPGVAAAAFTEIRIDEHPEAVAELLKLTGGRRLLPVLVERGRILVAPDGGSTF